MLSVSEGEGISLITPFRTDDPWRQGSYDWLQQYYRIWLPGAEMITSAAQPIGHTDPFCKTYAMNDAFIRSSGDIIVMLDADCFIDCDTILNCANEMRAARDNGESLWFVPYRRFYRLSEPMSEFFMSFYPTDPLLLADPMPAELMDSDYGVSSGHWYGALIQIHTQESFASVGGMDERFRGWGGEDIAFMQAVDTLHGKHKTFNGPVYHVWHPTTSFRYRGVKMWDGQDRPLNEGLAGKYNAAFGDRERMRQLVSRQNFEI